MLSAHLAVAFVLRLLGLPRDGDAALNGVVIRYDERGESDVISRGNHVTRQPHVPHEALLAGEQAHHAQLEVLLAIWRLNFALPLAQVVSC